MRHLLNGGGHFVDGSGRLIRLGTLLIEQLSTGARQVGRLRGTFLDVLSRIFQARQRRLQARLLADHGHVQQCLGASVVTVGQRHQFAGKGFGMLVQRPQDQGTGAVQLIGPEREHDGEGDGGQPAPVEHRLQPQDQGCGENQRPRTHQAVGPLLQMWHGRLALAQASVEPLRTALLRFAWQRTHRLVTDHAAVFVHRRDIGTNPVEVTVLRAVLDDAHPGLSLLDGVPHMAEHARRHVRVAHDVVWLADQLFTGETADRDEGVVAIGDLAVEVGGGDQALIGGKGSFALSHWQVLAHRGIPVECMGEADV